MLNLYLSLQDGLLRGMLPLAQVGITIELSGITMLLLFMAIGAYTGWNQGVRAILTLSLGTIIAYVVCVSGGNLLIDIINRLWTNGPRLVAFLVGNDPAAVTPLDPAISAEVQIPLFFRFALYIAIVLLSWFFSTRAPWHGGIVGHEPLARPLGLFAGALIALMWASAASVFYLEYLFNGGAPFEPFTAVLGALPDVRQLVPSLITIFVLILFGIVFWSLPRLLSVLPPNKK